MTIKSRLIFFPTNCIMVCHTYIIIAVWTHDLLKKCADNIKYAVAASKTKEEYHVWEAAKTLQME